MRLAGRIEPGRGSGASTGHVGGGATGFAGRTACGFFVGFLAVALVFRDRAESGAWADVPIAALHRNTSAAATKRPPLHSRRGVIECVGGWVGRWTSIGM